MTQELDSVYLTGFRWCGKTHNGGLLAERLGWRFIDTDKYITDLTGKTPEDWSNGGRNWLPYRQVEYETLLQIRSMKQVVVATGGGMLVNTDRERGTDTPMGRLMAVTVQSIPKSRLILLTASPSVIEERIRNKATDKNSLSRPPLNPVLASQWRGMSHDERLEAIVEDAMSSLAERHERYLALTDRVVDTSNKTHEQAVEEMFAHAMNKI